MIGFSVFFIACSAGLHRHLPKAPPNDAVDDSLVTAGIQKFDNEDYAGAIRDFNIALLRNPHNLYAIYELALTYSHLKEFQRSHQYCQRLFGYDTDLHAKAYVILGTNADHAGQPDEAIKIYREGIRRYPDNYMLRYNLAISYINQKQHEKAKHQLKKALILKPSHASSHLALGHIWDYEENRIPAILAYTRFLILENQSSRAEEVRQALRYLLFYGITEDSTNRYNVTLSQKMPTHEGQFQYTSALLSLTAALHVAKLAKKEITEKECLAQIYDALFLALGNDATKQDSVFVFRYYVPYFVELRNKKYTSIMTDYLFQYKEEYPTLFLDWSEHFQWNTRID